MNDCLSDEILNLFVYSLIYLKKMMIEGYELKQLWLDLIILCVRLAFVPFIDINLCQKPKKTSIPNERIS